MSSFLRKADASLVFTLVVITATSAPTLSLAVVVQEHSFIPSYATSPQHLSLIDDNNDVSLDDGSLMTRKIV